jgi:trk system potassium uptake protein TrkA
VRGKQFLVIGAGRFGSAVARTLYNLGHEVVIVDRSEDAIEQVMNEVTHAAIVDATDEDALRKLGCANFNAVVVAIGANLEANILATVAAKACGAKYVVSKAASKLAAQVLAKVGADEVIRPEHDMGVRTARQLASPSIIDAFDLGADHAVIEVDVRQKLTGTLADLQLRKRFGVQAIAVNREGKVDVGLHGDFELKPGDKVVMLGGNDAIDRISDYLSA